ncbi:MAG: glutamate 5-kinase [Alphaproteobacteria bacterium]|nr:glutamate 5-kinase [Alphaproteobacteria bacterium]
MSQENQTLVGFEVIDKASILVVKIGSSLLLKDEALNHDWLAALAGDIAALKNSDKQVIVVTSGAVSLGCAALGLERHQLTLEQSQAAAAAGQIELAQGWQAALGQQQLAAAQILLTAEDTEQRRRYLNARQTLTTLLVHGAVPIINENDTVATQELRYGDNDRLAARVAAMVSADCLILLSDIDGLYDADPSAHEQANFIANVSQVDAKIEAMAGGTGSSYGSGGMVTKLQAAQIAQRAGCHMVLASGRPSAPISALIEGARHTLFQAHDNPHSARAAWIAGGLQPGGALHLDAGAVRALQAGKSLLPVGLTGLAGHFERGDCVALMAPDGSEIGRGLSAYASTEAQRMIGLTSEAMQAELGYRGRAEMVHRDDMVLTVAPNSDKTEDKD